MNHSNGKDQITAVGLYRAVRGSACIPLALRLGFRLKDDFSITKIARYQNSHLTCFQ